MKQLFFIIFLVIPLPLAAQVQEFIVGQHLTITARYDSESNRFLNGASEGEENTCWRVDNITSEGVVLTLVKGTFRPWWDKDTVYNPGDYTDTWFTSDAYREHHPDAADTDELKGIFTAHVTCP